MDANAILGQLDAHDRCPTRGEALEWKKKKCSKIGTREQRGKAIEFFNNASISSNLKVVDRAIKDMPIQEKKMKLNLKRLIAKDEYEKSGETKPCNDEILQIPPDSFEKNTHAYHVNNDATEFNCNQCDFKSNSQQDVIIHMNKKRKEVWTNMLQAKMLPDKRFIDWYESPADFKHLCLENNLPTPDIERKWFIFI